MSLFRDLNLSATTAGFVAVLVGFTSSVAIVFQTALAIGATPELITSWMWALGLGLCCAIPSLILKQPVMVAWRTPRAAVTGQLLAFPRELVLAIASIALRGSIGGGLNAALKDEPHREAALITFLLTLSGLTLWGVGSAFWGVVAGAIALFVQQYRSRKPHP
ncbi:benzoate/H(+) symporter BenE family transporter [Hydrogenophaga sp.]|uniref:benzoate/H(+) symporter BenE family transporter n=1 Tax=Hydrogenophaga sp. TaxID=1904254 RepID=UPI0025C3EE27|nr:benzoate/H(+) symporter BenE family transporter [Hydrogenophaga sp.]